ncbi:MAG: 1-acyl-sn-glycerol-3-phosphate acyltransferase [Saprospiraceae bacterium]|nr:1-acyl-sn-glycerol-3-phosphate acyltransferase [Saprospiraceae bacterium]MCB9318407.1 1-acyl-sn-glycerol-3-phosphate acyltransferase [Lewinellaceae bacterium]
MKQILYPLRAILRLFGLFGLTLFYLIWVLIKNIFSGNVEEGMRFRKEVWAKHMMRIGGIQLKRVGTPPEHGHLVVVNHRSSIDPLINLADALLFPVAKVEFGRWPIIGQGAWATGIVFVDRSSTASRARTRIAIAEALRKGFNVLIYPEGKTSNRYPTQLFKKGSFEVAAENHFPVQPVAMEYEDRNDNWDHSCNFILHFIRHFGKPVSIVELRYGPVIRSGNYRTLLEKSQSWIDGQIDVMRSAWDGPNWKGRQTSIIRPATSTPLK